MTDSRAVARYDGPRTTADLATYSKLLAVNSTADREWRNDALPAIFRGNPAAVAFAVEYAKALDVSPVTAIIGIHIVDGKPTASAGLISALVRRAGHKIRTSITGSVDDGTAVAVTSIWRADDPDFEYRSEWTISRAIRANLMKRTPDGKVVAAKDKSAWSTYPENMLKARSITECARDAAEDAILGVHYTPEELGVDVDESGDPVYTVTTVPSTRVEETRPPAGSRTDAGSGTPAPTRDDDPPHAPTVEDPAPAEAAPPSPVYDGPGDYCREWILAASSRDDLAAGWTGTEGLSAALARSTLCADENGVLTNVFDLFKRQTAAVDAGAPLRDRLGGAGDDGGTTPDPDPQPGDTGPQSAPETVEGKVVTLDDLTTTEAAPNRDDLNRIMRGLTTAQLDGVVSYCQLNGLDPRDGEEACGAIVEAISTGEAFPDKVRPADPVALVTEILGGTVVEETRVTDPVELHAREIAECRQEDNDDAAQARPAHRPPPGAGRDAFKQARATIQKGDNA